MVVRLTTRELEFRFEESDGQAPALAGIDLDVRAGELLAILGPNGAGKSTLLRLLAGLLNPTAGEVCLQERPVTSWSARERARRVALVPQSTTAMPDVTIDAFVGYGRYSQSRLFGGPSAADRAAVACALEAADLVDLNHRPLAEVSGGQRQRALIARALAQEAEVLLVDEPTNALDPGHQLRVLELLTGLSEMGKAVVVVTHELNLASQFADRVLLLREGRAVASGSVTEVLVPEVLHGVYGSELCFGSLPVARGGERPFVLPWKRPRD